MTVDLMTALEPLTSVMDRRKSDSRRVVTDRRKRVKQSIGIEISATGVCLAIVQQAQDGEKHKLFTEHVPFVAESGPVRGQWDSGELKAVLKSLVEKNRLSGQCVTVGIGGDACVTRSLVGENEEVDTNVSELKERSHRFLTLGRGEKVCCYAEKQINAKRKRAWVTISQREFVENVVDAVVEAGLRVARIEHSLVALCEIAGSMKFDDEFPVLLATADSAGVNLVVSHQGQLLLDYRSSKKILGDVCSPTSWADSVLKHIKCLRRFLQTQVPAEFDSLKVVYLPGRKAVQSGIASQLQEKHLLEVRGLPVKSFSCQFDCQTEPPECPEMLAAIWYAGRSYSSEVGTTADLLTTVRRSDELSWVALTKLLWPIAATLMVIVGLFVHTNAQNGRADELEAQIESMATTRIEAQRLEIEVERRQEVHSTALALRQQVKKTELNEILSKTGRLLPQGTWLEALTVDSAATVNIVGASFTDEAIYEYLTRLKDSNLFAHVSLRATQKIQSNGGPAFRFEVTAEVRRSDGAETSSNMAQTEMGASNHG